METVMGRLERPLNPEAGEIEHFAADLRALRSRAGQPTYRKMAPQAHYAVSTLSQAAAGNRLPTLEVALAYVRACGADPAVQQDWCRRWQQLATQLDPDRGDEAGRLAADQPAEPVVPPRSATAGRRRPGAAILAGVALACLVLITGCLLTITADQATKSAVLVHVVLPPDGADPRQSGCAQDAINLGVTEVAAARPPRRDYGTVFLQYSPACLSAWPRFQYNARTPLGSGLLLATIRPADHRETDYADVFQGEWNWGNMLQTTRGCVLVKVVLAVTGQPAAVGSTGCLRSNR
jgi:hypothetical protein